MFPQTSSRTVALITAPILAICLTACGYFPKTSAEAAPPASPSPSASPTPNPEALKVKDTWTNAELPTQPDLSDQSLQGGANAAAYFFELFWHATHAKEYNVIEEYVIPGSQAEQLTKTLIRKFSDGNQVFENNEIASINMIILQKDGPDEYVYAIDFDSRPGKTTFGNRVELTVYEGGTDYFVITMKYVENQWILDAVQHGTPRGENS